MSMCSGSGKSFNPLPKMTTDPLMALFSQSVNVRAADLLYLDIAAAAEIREQLADTLLPDRHRLGKFGAENSPIVGQKQL